ncbi:hypothetical protein FRC04_008246 [Tulasnella sp. 424]|nr:hypothetical protein FRC04_008246 [Tulasnella sp. 424]KAG8959180.1 hypothetical protein FRC05_007982 [Tulasnella sp. 425]
MTDQMTHLLHTRQASPSTISSREISLELPQLGEEAEINWDAILFSPPHSPLSITSSLLALSPINSNDYFSDLDVLELDQSPQPSPPRSPSPLSVKLRPLHLSCKSCGSSLISPPLSPVARYSLAPKRTTRSQNQDPSDTPPTVAQASTKPAARAGRKGKLATIDNATVDLPATAPAPASVAATRGRKRKLASVDNSTIDVPTAAPAPAPAPALPTAKAKTAAKGKTKATASNTRVPTQPVAEPAPDNLPETTASTQTTGGEAPASNQVTEATTQPEATAAGPSGPSPNQAAQATNCKAKEENRALKKIRVLYLKSQTPDTGAGSSSSVPDGSVPRPPGERGKNRWNMQTALKLAHDGDTYNAVLATTHDAVWGAGLEWRLKFDEQDPARLAACYGQMKRVHPHLKQFKNDWACRELVLGALQNRRKTEHAKIKGLMTNKKTSHEPSKRKGFKPRTKKAGSESAAGDDEDMELAAGGDNDSEN